MASNGPDRVENTELSQDEEVLPSYYDIMMIAQTGFGKSTVGNKLLGIDPETKSLLEAHQMGEDSVIRQWDFDGDEKPYFETGDGSESVTKKCKLLSNEKTMNRVLDTRGFTDTESTRQYGAIKGNLQNFRWILQAQKTYDLRFSRVLYFLPNRGPPERSDGHLQEEISVMYSFFGQKIFDVMVIIATNNKRDRYQQVGFSEEDIAETKEVFKFAFQGITGVELLKCPPVIYVPFNENHEELMEKIIGADVISDAEMLCFSPEFPKVHNFDSEQGEEVPLVKIDMPHKEKRESFRRNRGKCFRFEDRCTRCDIKIVQERLPSGAEVPVHVVFENGDEEVYDNSYCHPFFHPKYARLTRIVGGLAHILTLGMGIAYEMLFKVNSWPGFTNREEVCAQCGNSPGSDGCKPVNQFCELGGENYKVDHLKELDTEQLLAESEED